MVVSVVEMIGLRRSLPAAMIASYIAIPDFLMRFIRSTRTIESLTTMPARPTRPIKLMIEKLLPVTRRPTMAPRMDSGRAVRIAKG